MTGCYLSIKQQYGRNVNESWMLLRRRRLWASKPKLNALINHPVQGLCADIIKLAGLKLTRTLMDYPRILPEPLAVQLQVGQSNRASIGYSTLVFDYSWRPL